MELVQEVLYVQYARIFQYLHGIRGPAILPKELSLNDPSRVTGFLLM